MDSRLDFRYSIRRPPDGPVVELSAEEAEKMLLKNLDEAKADPTEALWRLAHFYKQAKQHEKALERLRQLMQRLPDPEQKAQCVLTMGQAMEQVSDGPAGEARPVFRDLMWEGADLAARTTRKPM